MLAPQQPKPTKPPFQSALAPAWRSKVLGAAPTSGGEGPVDERVEGFLLPARGYQAPEGRPSLVWVALALAEPGAGQKSPSGRLIA